MIRRYFTFVNVILFLLAFLIGFIIYGIATRKKEAPEETISANVATASLPAASPSIKMSGLYKGEYADGILERKFLDDGSYTCRSYDSTDRLEYIIYGKWTFSDSAFHIVIDSLSSTTSYSYIDTALIVRTFPVRNIRGNSLEFFSDREKRSKPSSWDRWEKLY